MPCGGAGPDAALRRATLAKSSLLARAARASAAKPTFAVTGNYVIIKRYLYDQIETFRNRAPPTIYTTNTIDSLKRMKKSH